MSDRLLLKVQRYDNSDYGLAGGMFPSTYNLCSLRPKRNENGKSFSLSSSLFAVSGGLWPPLTFVIPQLSYYPAKG